MVNLLPSNIGLLSACLKRAGIDVRVFDTTHYRTAEKSLDDIRIENLQLRPFNLKEKGVELKNGVFEDFKETVEQFKPNIIGVSATDDTYQLGIDLLSKVKEKAIFTIIGGIYPTFSPETVILNENVDAICIGEGEEALVELCKKMQVGEDITNIQNLWIKKGDKIYKNSLRPPVDLDELPFDDFTVFEDNRLYRPMQGKVFRMLPVTIDRGCPFNCTYCAAPSQRKLYKDTGANRYFRVKSVSKVIEELKYQIQKHNADYLYFNSETFFARQEDSIEEFAKVYSTEIRLPFWCQTRIETITEKRARMLVSMNCNRISIGLEHGNEEFRKKILKKYFINKQVINGFKLLEKYEIPVTVNNIIGFPDETRELSFDTIKLNRQIHTDTINALCFVPYTGTPLRQYCIDKGYLDPNAKTDSVIKKSILNMPNFTAEQIQGIIRTFSLYVRLPESYFNRIRIAEQLNEEGNRMYSELKDIFHKKYF
jgi:radical SAM superfamily enzyme YgiQ (UPF0313 family)